LLAALGAVALMAGALVVARPPAPAVGAGSACGISVNPIVCENQKPGTSPDEWDIDGAGDPSIQGFATDISVNAGSSVNFKIDTNAKAYGITIYRTGWYQGLGARKIATVTPSATLPQTQPQCITDVSTELYDCGTWKTSATWAVPADAVSGVYLALLHRNDTGGESQILFIVRNDGNTSDVVFQTSDPTWQAYNTYGGSDFYQGSANGRAYKISYNRPLVTRGSSEGRDSYFSSEYATVRFLERNGYDVSYLAGVDSDRRGAELKKHKVFLSVGHDEYWSGAQRANVEAARDAGVNLQFLSGNEVYWRTRYENSADGTNTPYRTLVSYKETWGNADNGWGAKIDPSTQWTGTWRDPRFADASQGAGLPENTLTGTMYMVNNDDLAVTVSAAEGKTRLWRNTSLASLAAGTAAPLAAHTVGYESDEDVDNGMRPAGLIHLSTTVGPTPQYLTDYGNVTVSGTTVHHLTLYRAGSGALVFGAGTVQWGWGLDASHDGNGAPADARMQQAQVNLLADMGAQPGSLMNTLTPASKSTDTTAPTTTISSPAAGASVVHGSRVTVTGTASDSGGVVAGVEVSTDGGASWRAATGTTSWSYSYIQQGAGTATIRARAIDDSANYSASGTTVNLTVTGSASVFGQETPAESATNDSSATELGLRFTPASDGFVSGVRFYKASGNTGTHVGSLWNASGQRLAQVTFSNETATGWQKATFSSPVEVTEGTHYTVSYSAPQGHYSYTQRYWPYVARATSPVEATPGLGAAAPGTFGSVGSMPTDTWNEANYFVDVLFDKVDGSPLRIVGATPLQGSSSNDPSAPVTVTFSRAVDPTSLTMSVKDSSGHAAGGAVSYDASTRTATFRPSLPLASAATFTVSVGAKDTAGVALASGTGTWTFATAEATRAAGDCPCSLRPELSVPALAAAPDPASVTLGVRFTSSQSGTVSALRFYKGVGNTGTHTATLWSADRTQLGSVTFNESTQGWQTGTLSAPVRITAGATYVVSYTAPNGHYAATAGAYSSSYTRGPLSVPASGAVYSYGGGFPDDTSTTDYGVDVVFSPLATGPALVSRTPQDGATNVATSASVSATFDAAVASASVLVSAGGSSVAGTTTLGNASKTVTFTPSQPLPQGAAVTVSVTNVVGSNGGAGTPAAWTFTTIGSGATPVTTFFSGTPASSTATNDAASVVLGMDFTTSTPGTIGALRFYKAGSNAGPHTGWLWGADDNVPLAQVTFAGETASGWQRAQLSAPVSIAPGTTYTVSYLAPQGNYSYQAGVFAAPVTSGALTAVSPGNGLYRYGSGGRPDDTAPNATSYLVDVEFTAGTGGGDPGPGGVPAGAQTLFDQNTPSVAATADTDAVELGTAFTVAQPGQATALRFYKGTGNTGTHVGTLWGPGGEVLSRVTFTGESAAGWQSMALPTPVDLVPGTRYVASYYAPAGHFAYASQYFASARVNGNLTGLGTNNGVFRYGVGGGFPTSSSQAAAYYVDAAVVFGGQQANAAPAASPSPTLTPTASPTPTASSASPSPTPSASPSPTAAVPPSPTASASPGPTPTASSTPSPTRTTTSSAPARGRR